MTAPFDEAEAASRLGYSGERFESVSPYKIDGVYWVVIGSADKRIGRPVIVDRGHVVGEKGYAFGMAWLRRLASRENVPDPSIVPQVLRWYDALPIGWDENHSAAVDPQTHERGSVKLRPIELKLVSPSYIQPRPRKVQPAPPGTPSAPPFPAGNPPGGYAPPRPSRATLKEVSGKLTWIVEAIDPWTKEWKEELREVAEQ